MGEFFDWIFFRNKHNKIAVHCKTEEEAIDFCEQMDKHGLKWSTDSSYLRHNYYDTYGPETCYTNNGQFNDLKYLKTLKYRIFEWSDYMEVTPRDILKVGYIVELRNGNWYVYLPYEKGHAFVKSCFDPIDLECYNCELNSKENKDLDVMKIYGYSKTLADIWPSNIIDIWDSAPKGHPLLWERKERSEMEMTVKEMKQKLEEILNAKIVEE